LGAKKKLRIFATIPETAVQDLQIVSHSFKGVESYGNHFDEKNWLPVFWGETRLFSTIFLPLIFKDSSRFQIIFLHFQGWGKR
jgi:hypothetical protein